MRAAFGKHREHRGCLFATRLLSTLIVDLLHTILRSRTPYISCQQPEICSNLTSPLIIMEHSHTPTLVSSDTKTPPAAIKRNVTNGHITNGTERAGSEPVDPTALSKALKDMEDAGRVRERTPGASPSRKRQRVYGDRSVKNLSRCDFQENEDLERCMVASLVTLNLA